MAVEAAKNVWNLDPDGAYCYLVNGAEAGLIIDSGIGNVSVLAEARKIAGEDKPLMLVNTHYHVDHIAGNRGFKAAWANPADFDRIRPVTPVLFPATEGVEFTLGDRVLQVIECPGHTPGSISLIDRWHRIIFTGDCVASVPIWMQGPDADLSAYMYTMDRLLALQGEADTVLGCHGPMPLKLSLCQNLKELAGGILDGRVAGEVRNLSELGGPDEPVRLCRGDGVSMLRPI